jgi:serum/glucocorticoid-regulated kinase 2
LVEFIRAEVTKSEHEQPMIGVKSYFSSIPLDYILSKLDLPLSILNAFPNHPIIIQPHYAMPKEIKSKKVGLKDFEFIRCVGSGGFSKV